MRPIKTALKKLNANKIAKKFHDFAEYALEILIRVIKSHLFSNIFHSLPVLIHIQKSGGICRRFSMIGQLIIARAINKAYFFSG